MSIENSDRNARKLGYVTLVMLYSFFYAVGQYPQSQNTQDHSKSHGKDTSRVISLVSLSRSLLYEKPVTGVSYGIEALQLARKINFERGIGMALNALGNCYRMTGNYTKGLELHFEALRLFDKLRDTEGLANSYHGISVVNEDQGYYKESLEYAHKVILYANVKNNDMQLLRIQSNMGRSFEQLGMLDSALLYEQNAYELSLKLKDSIFRGLVLCRLGNIHYGMKNADMALVYYKTGIAIAKTTKNNNSLEELYYSLSLFYRRQNQNDSSIYYARHALGVAFLLANPSPVIRSCILLTEIFNSRNQLDSAFKYQSVAMNTKDTLLTEQKIKQQQIMALQEIERQEEKERNELENEAVRKQNIEYAFVGVCIVTVIIVFMILSQSIIAKPKTIRYFGIIALLLTFEFVNLLIHPFLANVTHHSPALMLVALVTIAAVLVPVHHRLQKWVTQHLVEKNKKIRLAAAKKTILMIEKESDES